MPGAGRADNQEEEASIEMERGWAAEKVRRAAEKVRRLEAERDLRAAVPVNQRKTWHGLTREEQDQLSDDDLRSFQYWQCGEEAPR